MVCPLCKTEARISSSTNVLKGGKLYRRMHFVCRNKQCSNYNKEVGIEEVEIPLVIESDEEASE